MTGTHVVFLGPSLPLTEARRIHPEAVLLPPAGQADLLSALRRYRPHAIALVDGSFLHTMSVFHKEIVAALSEGVWVLGGASMGALRAAECDSLGMVGIGEIYRSYASGDLTDDDEVAVVHGPAETGYRALSDALVDLRFALDRAVDRGVVDEATAAMLLAGQRRRWFPDRSRRAVLADAAAAGIAGERVDALGRVLAQAPSLKAADARAVLQALRSLPEHPIPVAQRPALVESGFLSRLRARDIRLGEDLTPHRLMWFSALNHPAHEAVRTEAVRSLALELLARLMRIDVTDEDRSRARTRVAARAGTSPEGLTRWAADVDLTEEELASTVEREAVGVAFERWALRSGQQADVTPAYLDVLRLRGEYPALRDRAAAVEGLAGQQPPTANPVGLGTLVARHAAVSGWRVPADLEAWLADSALGGPAELAERLDTYARARDRIIAVSRGRRDPGPQG